MDSKIQYEKIIVESISSFTIHKTIFDFWRSITVLRWELHFAD